MKLNVKRRASALALLLAAAGCGPTPQEQIAMDQGRCASFGLNFGSPDFGRCMMDLSFQRDQRQAEDSRTRLQINAMESLARDRQRDRDRAREEDKRREYERAKARRDGCDQVAKPIYC